MLLPSIPQSANPVLQASSLRVRIFSAAIGQLSKALSRSKRETQRHMKSSSVTSRAHRANWEMEERRFYSAQANKTQPLLYIGNMCAAKALYKAYKGIITGLHMPKC